MRSSGLRLSLSGFGTTVGRVCVEIAQRSSNGNCNQGCPLLTPPLGIGARDFGQYESQALNVPKNIMAVGRGETAVPVLPRAAKLDGKTTM